MTVTKWMWLAGIGILVLPVCFFLFQGWRSQRMSRSETSLPPTALTPCPKTPNCVCSQETSSKHQIEALNIKGHDTQTAWSILAQLLEKFPKTQVTIQEGGYLHAEVKTSLFGFVDDLEFLLDSEAETIHVRSASRVGHSDFGVNRKRIEEFRTRFQQALAEHPPEN